MQIIFKLGLSALLSSFAHCNPVIIGQNGVLAVDATRTSFSENPTSAKINIYDPFVMPLLSDKDLYHSSIGSSRQAANMKDELSKRKVIESEHKKNGSLTIQQLHQFMRI